MYASTNQWSHRLDPMVTTRRSSMCLDDPPVENVTRSALDGTDSAPRLLWIPKALESNPRLRWGDSHLVLQTCASWMDSQLFGRSSSSGGESRASICLFAKRPLS